MAIHSFKPSFDIIAEPREQTYLDLLQFAASRCWSFSLVWRDQFKFAQSAYDIKHSLKPFLLSNNRANAWPGTTLIGHEAVVCRYKVADESVRLLQKAGALYSWLQPDLPEDLAFYTSQDIVWLASISHEGKAWLCDDSLQPAEIYSYVKDIKLKYSRGF